MSPFCNHHQHQSPVFQKMDESCRQHSHFFSCQIPNIQWNLAEFPASEGLPISERSNTTFGACSHHWTSQLNPKFGALFSGRERRFLPLILSTKQ